MKNKTIVVTGAGRGVGKYIAKRLGREGADIVVTARTVEDIEEVAEEINNEGGSAIFVRGDVTEESDVKEVINTAIDRFGKVDILINNAGIGLRKFIWEIEEEEFQKVMDVNVKGVFLFMKNIIPRMGKNGLIINISSGAGKTGIPTLSAYCASKFAVIGLTEAAAVEVRDIKIIAFCPGSIDTGMFRRMFPEEKASLLPEDVAERITDICIHPEKYHSGESVEFYKPI